jgi:dTDP-4-dehydrorhamnose reductase
VSERVLVVGATGMVGQAVMAAAAARGYDTVGAARSGADETVDVASEDAVRALVEGRRPSLVVNCAAIVDHAACEDDPGRAYVVNARAAGLLGAAARAVDARFVHISTDQYWTGDGDGVHDERAPVRLLNEYARSKYAGEAFALTDPQALVVRTNVTGLRGDEGRPTFFEWVVSALRAGEPMTLFDDFYTSTVDARTLAEAVLDLAGEVSGLLNVASSEVSNKKRFIETVADRMSVPMPPNETASVRNLKPPRGESLGLDVARAESLLGRPLPDLGATVDALVSAHETTSVA